MRINLAVYVEHLMFVEEQVDAPMTKRKPFTVEGTPLERKMFVIKLHTGPITI